MQSARRHRLRSVVWAGVFCLTCSCAGLIAALAAVAAVCLFALGERAFHETDPLPYPSLQGSIIFVLAVSLVFAALYVPVLVATWRFAGRIVLQRARVRPRNELEKRRTDNIAEEVAIAAGLPVPGIMIVNDQAPNALSAGTDREATIALTTGLLDALNRQQLQAVVAHEMAHIANGDIKFTTFLSAASSRWTALKEWIDREVECSPRNNPLILVAPVVTLVSHLGALSSLAASREREFLADAGAIAITRDRQSLVEALEILADGEPSETCGRELAPVLIVDPLDPRSGDGGLRGTHPPVKERVRRLRKVVAES